MLKTKDFRNFRGLGLQPLVETIIGVRLAALSSFASGLEEANCFMEKGNEIKDPERKKKG